MISKLLTTFCCLTEKSNVGTFSQKMALGAVFILGALGVNAQVSSYTTTGTTVGQTYTSIAGVLGVQGVFNTTVNTTLDNAIATNVPIGFDFNFNGKVYTTCNVSFNGFITFGTTAASVPAATEFFPISSTAGYEGVIAGYAHDLKGVAVDVLRVNEGTVGNRTFTLQWRAYRTATLTPPMDIQIILHESDPLNTTNPGVVEIKFNAVTASQAAQALRTGQLGLRGETNTDFNNKNFTTATTWPTGAGGLFPRGQNNAAIVQTRFNVANSIPAVTTFTYTPPVCFAPKAVRATPISITENSATITWTAPLVAPVNGYEYLVSETAPTAMNYNAHLPAYPKNTTTPTGSVGAGITTATVGSLTPDRVHYIYVRSNCGGLSGWSAAGTFTTLCSPTAVPPVYSQNFEAGFTPPAVPPCNRIERLTNEPVAALGVWATAAVGAAPGVYGFPSKRVQSTTGGTNDNDTTYFIEGLTLTGGVSYRLSYQYGSSTQVASTEQSMQVGIYSRPLSSAFTEALADHPSIKGGAFTNVINFTPASTGTYYIGFYDYSAAGNATLFLDNITVGLTSCFPPTLNPASGMTSGSAFISWPAATPAPGAGYQYYYSTSATAPTGATVPLGSTGAGVLDFTLGGLAPSTTYYVWVRSSCGGTDFSNWSAPISFMTQAGPTPPSCVPSGLTFYQDPNGITNVTFSNVNNTTGIESGNYGDYSYLTGYAGRGTTVPISITYRTGYSYDTMIWVDWNNDGDFDDTLPFPELVFTGASAATPTAVVTASIAVPMGASLGSHRIRIGGMDFGPPALTPCRAGNWQAFEDYTLYVTSTPPDITLSDYAETICQGSTFTVGVSSTHSNYTTYTWEPPTGVTGTVATGFTFNPTSTTTYVLSGFNPVTFHRTTSPPLVITVSNAPTAVSITPATLTVCQNATTLAPLTVAGGIVSGVTIFSENFNGSAPGWVQQNSTSGSPIPGDEGLAAWGLAPNGYAPFFFTTIYSNDNSQFIFTESDGPGNGSTTRTFLLSPPINLTNYSSAILSFYQFYMSYNGGEAAYVDVVAGSTTAPNAVGQLGTVFSHNGLSDIGTPNNFALTNNLDLTPYIPQGTIRLRFRYEGTWDFGWAVDNVLITGSGPSTYTWFPTTGLYNDAAGTVNYTGDARATVYPKPLSATAYTVTATAFGCPVTSAPVTVNVTQVNGGAMPVTSQTICGGSAPSDIVLTPATVFGNVLHWQAADDASFTTNLVTIAGSAGLTTLPTALIGTITGPRYFRAVVEASGCAVVYSPTHTITIPTTTWNGVGPWSNGVPTSSVQAVFTGNYTSSGNLSACTVRVTGSSIVTISTGNTLSVQGVVDVSNSARLIFEDDSSLLQASDVTNVGDITYRRTTTMGGYDYTYWSSPVNAQTLSTFSPLTRPDKYFWFNATSYIWQTITAPGITSMTKGRGYIIRAPDGVPGNLQYSPAPWTGHFGYNGGLHGGGIPNNGPITVPVVYNGTIDPVTGLLRNLDCVGNPYPSAISANSLLGNAANVGVLGAGGTTIYFWTHNTPITAQQYDNDDYASYNYTGGTSGTGSGQAADNPSPNGNIPDGNIAAGQAFMIELVNSGNLHFNNTMRLSGLNTQFFRSADVSNQVDAIASLERHRIWLELKNDNGAYKQALVGYIENATDGFDQGFDGRLVESGNPISIYSFVDNHKLTIQGKALPFNTADVIPLGYRSNIAGTFHIKMPVTDGLFEDQDVYLEDKLLNVVHDLKQGPYVFTTEIGTFDTRFDLKFVDSTLATEKPIFGQNGVVVYKNNSSIFVETSKMAIGSVKIFDAQGRLITERNSINSDKVEFNNLNVSQQVLMVQITSNDNVTVTKKIVF